MEKLSALQQSLFVLTAIQNSMEPSLRAFKRYLNDEELHYVLTNKMIIDVCSFKNEWSKLSFIAKEDDEVKETLKICSPGLRRIKKWHGLDSVRNTMLAHNFRDKRTGYNIVDVSAVYFSEDVPKNYIEILLLCEISVFCCAIAVSRHRKHINGIDLDHKENSILTGIATHKQFDEFIEIFKSHIIDIDPTLNCLWEKHERLCDIYRRNFK